VRPRRRGFIGASSVTPQGCPPISAVAGKVMTLIVEMVILRGYVAFNEW
jgi:hypothetical protein